MNPLTLTALDDFIAPGQECVKPLTPAKRVGGGAALDLEEPPRKASVTLQDCLACSGCITSAEAVLVAAQSVDEFLARVEAVRARNGLLVVSVAPEARASIAAHYGLADVAQCQRKLAALFEQLGARFVFDTTFAKRIHVLESRLEAATAERRPHRTLLSSDCPGWICYAEKSHPDLLPMISAVKSPQQICGVLVKRHLSRQLGLQPADVYHVAVMMCFDKKLEASRADFMEDGAVRHVDTVLSATEVLDVIARKQVDFAALPEHAAAAHCTQPLFAQLQSAPLTAGPGLASGFQAADVLRHVAKARHGLDVQSVEFRAGRNPDIREASLVVDGRSVYSVCVANGFRNIQNVVRRLKSRGGAEWDFVEVMACPSGCLNGGGQIRANTADREALKGKLKQVEELYLAGNTGGDDCNDAVTQRIYSDIVGAAPGSAQAREWFHTQYHAVPPMDTGLLIKW